MKPMHFVGLSIVGLNVAVLGWLLLRQDEAPAPTLAEAADPLLQDETMQAARYDLSDQQEDLNLILISMDALRYDATGLDGEGGSLTPNLDLLAEESVVFHQAVSSAPWTLPSHMSVWTGRWPSVHKVTNKLVPLSGGGWSDASLSGGIETYPDHLMRQGFTAAAFTGGAGVSGRFGFGRNFTTYLDDRPFAGLDYSMPAALNWLEDNREEHFFLFLHGYDVHGQYPLPQAEIESLSYEGSLSGDIEEQAELRELGLSAIDSPGAEPDLTERLSEQDGDFLKAIYELKVRDADQRLGTFLSKLKSMGLYEKSVIAVMSDHGDEFMEHGALDHGFSLYEEQLHVVMMIRMPGYGRKQAVQEQVRTLDLFPTLFDIMGLDGPTGVDGQSMLPLLQGEPWEAEVFSETDYRLYVNHRMVRQGDFKLILDLQDGKRELFNLSQDPLEQEDISSSDPRRTYEMEQALRTWMNRSSTNPENFLGLQQERIEIF